MFNEDFVLQTCNLPGQSPVSTVTSSITMSPCQPFPVCASIITYPAPQEAIIVADAASQFVTTFDHLLPATKCVPGNIVLHKMQGYFT